MRKAKVLRRWRGAQQGSSLLGCKWLKEFTEGMGETALVAQNEGRGGEGGVVVAPPEENEAAQQGEVGGGVPGAGAGFVLEPGGVAGMVVFVFDAPAGAGGAQGVGGGERFAQDKDAPAVAGLAGGFFDAVALDFEALGGVDEAELLGRDGEGAAVALVEAAVTGFKGRITWDTSKPDGTPRKLMDVSRLTGLGWKAKIGLHAGIENAYASFLSEKAAGKLRQ